MTELKSYYVDLEDGYDEGDNYFCDNKMYEIVRIDDADCLMEVKEIQTICTVKNIKKS